ncbi:uncharacterized protein BO66DRAFT_400970 [Aspergillus aculeatinus CBS 121060]|uniref:Uncharacterized protein n=1 Tax=Aspergillus aculeatinus CBS 121060 TaxID=1448322 RepID=A0ACD1HBI0_9EURO|nr:hypothetical protein BO66DRAFT_400970 [Aspergillus aculeatinus CBS 121060]RAH70937.1 hypothetical protein BO66DRAFT_400970 [Aspergillus aculeatinus CBS 121060]
MEDSALARILPHGDIIAKEQKKNQASQFQGRRRLLATQLSLVEYSKASQQPNQTPSERVCIYEYDSRRPGDFPADSPTDSLDSGMGETSTSELLPPGSTNLGGQIYS